MKYLIGLLTMFFVSTFCLAQQDQNITVNNAMISPAPLTQGVAGEVIFDFQATQGVTLNPAFTPPETVVMTMSFTQGVIPTGPPTSNQSPSPWTWEQEFIGGAYTWTGTLSTDVGQLYSERFTFPIMADINATPTPESQKDYGMRVDLTPHSRDPSTDTDDETFVETYMLAAELPVELSSFTAMNQGKDAVIDWSTSTEENNSHFELQASATGTNFETIATVNSKGSNGNSNSTLNYSYVDANAADKGNEMFYRLKNVNFDGSFAMSEIVSVSFNGNSAYNIFPNPVNHGENILVQSPNINSIKIFSNEGKLVKEYNESGNADQMTISTADFEKGIYFFLINQKESLKVIVQ